jgi:hypothetical protein
MIHWPCSIYLIDGGNKNYTQYVQIIYTHNADQPLLNVVK